MREQVKLKIGLWHARRGAILEQHTENELTLTIIHLLDLSGMLCVFGAP